MIGPILASAIIRQICYVSNFKAGAWDEGVLTPDANIVLNECRGASVCPNDFEGLKAYTTEDGRVITFRPDLNGQRMEDSAKRLKAHISKSVLLTPSSKQ